MNPDFEAAIVSSLGGHALTPAEMAMLSNHLPVDNPEGEVYQISDSDNFATRVLQNSTVTQDRSSLSWVKPTSNILEQFFSEAKYFHPENRHAILPENLEAQLFLHVNHSFWKENDIQELLNSSPLHN